MKDLTLIILDGKPVKDRISTEAGSFFEPVSSMMRQLDSHDISYDVLKTPLDKTPNKIESSLVMFVDPSFMVKEDYVFNAITLNNLHRDMGIVFGPTKIDTRSPDNTRYIKNSYYHYDLRFGSTYTADITDEPHNYGSLYNAVISGHLYNRIGYSSCKTPRSCFLDNGSFFKEVSKSSKIYYSSVLQKVKVLTPEDFDHKKISDYYYNLGYMDGMSQSLLSEKEKKDDLWTRFVESPEVIDPNHPRWLFEEVKTDENTNYLEFLVLLKCKYQIGYFEGALGKRVI